MSFFETTVVMTAVSRTIVICHDDTGNDILSFRKTTHVNKYVVSNNIYNI